MSEKSLIEWTDATWNPVTGCTKISPGCKNCYAESFAERWRGIAGHPYEQGFDLRLWPERLHLPEKWKSSRMIFVNSMSDLFHQGVPDKFIGQVFETMISSKQHIFQVLTKRPQRMAEWANNWFVSQVSCNGKLPWPSNVWAGVSVENQDYVWRIKELQRVPAQIRFLSVEPLLGEVNLTTPLLKGIHWVIVGGESGPKARPMRLGWVLSIRKQCKQNNVKFFFKQWGSYNSEGEFVGKHKAGRLLGGRTWDEIPNTKVPVV